MAEAELVIRQDKDGIATLTINRPEKRNALNMDVFIALDAHLAALETETDTIGCVVLRAAGPVFSAGADLGKQQRHPVKNFQGRTIQRLALLPQPTIAAVKGICYTGGLELLLGCDIIVADETARFADTHSHWGLTPGWGMSARLPRRIGPARARELMFTGSPIDAHEAARIGLANHAWSADSFEANLAKLMADIISRSWHSHRGNKRLMNESEGMELASALAWEKAHSPGIAPDFAERTAGKFGRG